MLPDYSEWLVGEKIAKEESAWAGAQLHLNYAAHISLMRSKFKFSKILELGCGTGWVPTQFGPDLEYVGIDKNPALLEIAEEKNIPSRKFCVADIRNTDVIRVMSNGPELVCSFAVLKHFSLDEFEDIFSGMLSLANLGLFSMNFSHENRDDGIEFHHSWITKEWLKDLLDKNGFELLYKTDVWQGLTWEKKTGEESIFGVKRT